VVATAAGTERSLFELAAHIARQRRRRARRYNSNEKHQHEVDDMAAAMEPVLFEFGADIVFAGHVHAYERSHRILGRGHCLGLPLSTCV